MIRPFLFACVVCTASVLVVAQQMTLREVQVLIDANHPSLKAYDYRVKALNRYADGAGALDPPRIGAGLFMAPYYTSLWKSGTDGAGGMGSFMVSAEQMITNPSKLSANRDYMRSMASEEASMRGAVRNDLYGVAGSYYVDWQIVKRKLPVIRESEELLRYLLKSIEIRYRYGLDKLNSYYKAQAMQSEIQSEIVMNEGQILRDRAALNTLMNRNKHEVFDIDTAFTIKSYESVRIDSSEVVSRRSDYKVLTERMNILSRKKHLEQTKQLPDLGVRYDHMFAFGAQPQQFTLMLMMTLPFAPWSASAYDANASAIDEEINELGSRRDALVNDVSGNAVQLRVALEIRIQQLKMYDASIIPSMRKNYETTFIAYEQNTGDLFVVLDALQNLKLSQIARLEILQQILQLQVEYETQMQLEGNGP